MAANKRKILEAARKYAQKGQKDRCLKEYEKLLKLDPRDAKLRLEIGDAHRRWGQVDEAIGAYSKVAEQYMAEGFDARAVAVFKQIQNLDPERYDAYVPLAELYERMGLTSEAIQALQTAADGFHREGKKRDALELLRRMAALDPSNTTSRIKVADLLRQEGMAEDAIAEYQAALAELESRGEHEAAGSVLERILEADPQRLDSMVALAQNLLRRGQGDAAEAIAKRALEKGGEEPEYLELLADVWRVQGRDDALKDTYKRLADLYRQRGDDDRARDIIQRFVPMDEFGPPLDEDAAEDLDPGLVGGMGGLDLAQPGGLDMPRGGGAEPHLGEDLLDDEEILMEEIASEEPHAEQPVLELSDEPEPELLLESPPAGRQLDEEELPPQPVEGEPDQLLAEASVYLRYGKRGQAIRNLEAVVEQVPRHRAALEKLGEAYAEDGESAAAVDTWLRAAEVAREEQDAGGLAVLRDRIAALDEAAAAGIAPLEAEPSHDAEDLLDLDVDVDVDVDVEPQLGDESAREPAAHNEVKLDDEAEIDIDIDVGDIDEEAAAGGDAGEEESERPAAAGPGASSSTSQQIQEELEEADFYLQQGLKDEARATYQRVLEMAPNHPLALVRLGELDADGGTEPEASARDTASPAAAEPDAAALGEEIGRDLADWSEDELGAEIEISGPDVELPDPDEVEIDIETPGDTAPELDFDLSSDTDPLADEKGGDTTDVGGATPVDTESVAPARSAPEPPPLAAASEGADFDLAAELSDALDGDSASASGSLSGADDGFAAVFREFKKGVSKTLGEGDQEAHWDLGIAYREMGLLEDAMGEFEMALTSPDRRVGGLHMLALCALDLGRADAAGERLEEALASRGLGAEQVLALRFDLGRVREAQGRLDEAREAWQAVADVEPGFCEVGERLAALDQAKPDPDPTQEYESFGDLMGEDDEAPAAASKAAAAAVEHESFEDLIAEAEQEGEVESVAAAELAEEPKPAAAPPRAPDSGDSGSGASGSGPRKKKKISFV